jgi:hypothetical protein
MSMHGHNKQKHKQLVGSHAQHFLLCLQQHPHLDSAVTKMVEQSTQNSDMPPVLRDHLPLFPILTRGSIVSTVTASSIFNFIINNP